MFAIRYLLVFLLMIFIGMGALSGQEKDAKDKAEKGAPGDSTPKEKWITTGQTTAVIKEYRESDGSLVLSIANTVINPQAIQQMQQAKMQAMQGGKANPQARAQANMALLKAQANLYQSKMEDVEFLLKDDVKIRQMNPPETFDDKGNKKRLTAKEKAELMGPEKGLPGYPADRSDLTNNTVAQFVFAVKPQKAGGKAANSGLVGVAAAKDDPETAREKRPRVSMIVITGRISDNAKK